MPEGRRGGSCQQLGVLVKGSWQACSLALPIFTSTWESLEEMMVWQKESFMNQAIAVSADETSVCSQMLATEESSTSLSDIAVKVLRTTA
jgi:hypothetical protein